MSDPYVGEIRMFGGSFAPVGWAFCNGQLLPIAENDTLFNLIGTTYGGDGQETFALPNLQSRVPIHAGSSGGSNHILGEQAGAETVTLVTASTPIHSHAVMASTDSAAGVTPVNNVVGATGALNLYRIPASNQNFASNAVTPEGGSQPHENTQPFLVISFIISLFGIWPTQS